MTNHAKRYNGHKNWQFWNVSLWINNDENLYRTAKCHIDECGAKYSAAVRMAAELEGESTPDGAKYTVATIRAAMEGL